MVFKRSSGGLLSAGAIVASPLVLGSDKKETLYTHPKVKLPPKLSNKSKEEQIVRCAHRVKPHSMAVDTLLRVFTSVRESPENPKFRTIDRSNVNYVTYVKDKPGAEDMLLAVNYRHLPRNNELRLEPRFFDMNLIILGISALERIRTSSEYKESKRQQAFHAEMRRVAKRNGSSTEVQHGVLNPCPKEPPKGRGTRVVVHLGAESEKIAGGRVERRFDGDDTLQDVLNWLGGCYGSEVLEKLRGSPDGSGESIREWCLCDLNCCSMLPFDVVKHKKSTLQYLGLFPSGKLGVRLSDSRWRDQREESNFSGGREGFVRQGSSRGLAAASLSML